MTFEKLGLSEEILRAVREQGYNEPTPIQAQAIPVVLEGRDIMAAAQTGTGKTAGFTLPILKLLQNEQAGHGHRPIRVLIITPTRELAAQIGESISTYGKYLPMRSTVIFGGVGAQPQIAKLRRGVDILVATPGRLLDLVNQRAADLSKVEVLILDEADRMLDMGFIHDIRKVLALVPKNRQTLLFSATFSDEIKRLANGILRSPVLVEVARNETVGLINQVVHQVGKTNKRALLSHLIVSQNWKQVLVFTRTKHGANRLTEQLGKDGIHAAAIHGNKSQTARTKALAGFKKGEIRVLVATDIAARGLDIDQLPHVVNYELPNVPEDYVHRIGRTGRAGRTGEAMSLVCHEEMKLLVAIEKLIRKKVKVVEVPGFTVDLATLAQQGKADASAANNQRPRNQRSSKGRHRPDNHQTRPGSSPARRRRRRG
ncbi:MAG: DEAD/DEAH box helicase [Mariprofundaceae bacterium]|nr:DEAD/DEAH box helicase [Mariprofundaceae bacterium]